MKKYTIQQQIDINTSYREQIPLEQVIKERKSRARQWKMQYLVGYVLSDISEESKQESSSSNESVEVLNDRVVDKLELEL